MIRYIIQRTNYALETPRNEWLSGCVYTPAENDILESISNLEWTVLIAEAYDWESEVDAYTRSKLIDGSSLVLNMSDD